MSRFAQHTKIRAQPGRRDALVAKFVEAARLQSTNSDCLLTLVGSCASEPDMVTLTEVWTTEHAHGTATESLAVQAWAADMPELTAGLIHQDRFEPIELLVLQLLCRIGAETSAVRSILR